MNDYENHVKEDLWPLGFKGEINPEIKYFGFKLEKNEFINTLKHNTIVAVETQGGVGYVALLEGTRAVFEIVELENGVVCNILKAMLDCKNPIYADEVYLRNGERLIIKYGPDGKRTFYPEKKNKKYNESKDF